MRRRASVVTHGALLGALVLGAAYGTVMLVGYLVAVTAAVTGRLDTAEMGGSGIVAGASMMLLWGSVIACGHRALLRQCRQSRRLSRWVVGASVPPASGLKTAATRARTSTRPFQVDDGRCYAFTHGIWTPRIVVSSGLVSAASSSELVAVLRHESHHARSRDPLKVLALNTWAEAFFFLPLLGVVFDRVLDRQEIRADRYAIRRCGVAPVAGALLRAADGPSVGSGAARVAIGGSPLLEARVAQLETGHAPRLLAHLPARTLLLTAPGTLLIAAYGVLVYQVCLASGVCCIG